MNTRSSSRIHRGASRISHADSIRQRHSKLHPIEALEDRTLLAVISVSNTNASGVGSLAQAIVDANNRAGLDSIVFNIPASDSRHQYYRDDGVAGQVTSANVSTTIATDDSAILGLDPDWPHSWFSIAPSTALPDITDGVLIDGYTQGQITPSAGDDAQANTNSVTSKLGLNSILRIEVTGQDAGDVSKGMFHLLSSGNTIRGLVVNRTQGPKIQWQFESGGNSVAGNFIGTDVSGSRSFPQGSDGLIGLGSVASQIGGIEPAARNLISGNTGARFGIAGVFSRGPDRIQGNLIGTDRSGTRALPNARGLYSSAGAGTLVGGTELDAANVISGNQIGLEPGINVGDQKKTGNVIQNNFIGTDVTGKLPIGNGEGILACVNTTIVGNTIAYNRVGVRVTCDGTVISRNSIHSSVDVGIDLGYDSITLNDVPPQSVPPDQDAGANGLQNFPILTEVSDLQPGTRIRGTLSSVPNSKFRLEFFANSERIEDTNGFGDSPAQPGEFGEGRTFIGSHEVTTDASGFVSFTADFSSLPEGQALVTSTATDITPINGAPRNNTSEFSRIVPLGGCGPVTHTGDIGIGTLREAMFCSMLTGGVVQFAIRHDDPRHFYYRNDGIAGQVSAAQIAVTTTTNDAVLADGDPDWPHSWFSILPARGLPVISRPIVIDGYTQPGSHKNSISSPGGLDTVLKIEIDGSNAGRNVGLDIGIGAELTRIHGLAINNFSLNGIRMTSYGGNVIGGNFIGTDVSSTIAKPNRLAGIRMSEERLNRIGGTSPEFRNLISGNGVGITLESTGADVVEGNLIGTDRSGSKIVANSTGIFISGPFAGSSLVTIGGTEPGAGNVIFGGPFGAAVVVKSLAFTKPFQSGSIINFLSDCRRPLKSAMDARTRFFETNAREDFERVTLVGSVFYACATSFGQKDFIAQANPILGNILVSGQSRVAIDLNDDGPTANDGDDPNTLAADPDYDGGPNNLQNFPVISAVKTSAGVTDISGSLSSLPNSVFRLEFFSNSKPHPTGFGGGEQWVGFLNVTTDASGNAAFTFRSPTAVSVARTVAATATLLVDLDDDPKTPLIPLDTSEFSRAVVATGDVKLGDLDGSGTVDARDIDVLSDAIRRGASEARFDLNGSGKVDADDRRFLIEDVLRTTAGDANLDGLFDSADLVAIFQSGQYEDAIFGNAGWETGDWDGDGDFLTSDLIAGFQTGRYLG